MDDPGPARDEPRDLVDLEDLPIRRHDQERRRGRLAGITVQRLQIDNVVSYLGGWEPRSYGGISVLTSGTKNDGFDGTRILDNLITGVGRTGIMSANGEELKGHPLDLRIAGNTVRSVKGDSIVALGRHRRPHRSPPQRERRQGGKLRRVRQAGRRRPRMRGSGPSARATW